MARCRYNSIIALSLLLGLRSAGMIILSSLCLAIWMGEGCQSSLPPPPQSTLEIYCCDSDGHLFITHTVWITVDSSVYNVIGGLESAVMLSCLICQTDKLVYVKRLQSLIIKNLLYIYYCLAILVLDCTSKETVVTARWVTGAN